MSTANSTDSDSKTAALLSQILLQTYGATQWEFAYRNLIGAFFAAGLTGLAYSEAYTFYYDNRKGDIPNKALVAWLLLCLTASTSLAVAGSLKIVEYWGSYVLWLRHDTIVETWMNLVTTVMIYPAILSYYSLRAWSTNGRSRTIIIAAGLDIAGMLAMGIAVGAVAMWMPWSGKMEDLLGAQGQVLKWGNKTKLLGRVWAIFALVSVVVLVIAICYPLLQLGRRTARVSNGIFRQMVWSLAVEVGPIVMLVMTTAICTFTGTAGGWGRPLVYLISPILCHSVFHSLATRKNLQQTLQALGEQVRSQEVADIPYTTTVNVEVSEPDEGRYGNISHKDGGSTNGSTANLATGYNNKPGSTELQRREFMRYAKAWEQPLTYSWSPQKYDFRLGVKEQAVVF